LKHQKDVMRRQQLLEAEEAAAEKALQEAAKAEEALQEALDSYREGKLSHRDSRP